MRTFATILTLLVLTVGMATAQVTAVTVNNQTAGATIQQGGIVNWAITLPPGAMSQNTLWLDANTNGTIEPGTDKPLFQFRQYDGLASGDGPGDSDGVPDGVIHTSVPLGLAPGSWILEATHNGSGASASFTMTAYPSPAHTISGTVTGPGGADVENIVLEATPSMGNDGPGSFWHGRTNALGNYTINIGTDPGETNPWRVRAAGESPTFGPYVLVPRDTVFSVSGHHTGVNFQLVQGTILTGLVTAASGGAGIEGATPHLHDALGPFGSGGGSEYKGFTDADGRYYIAVLPGKYFMHFTAHHYLEQWWDSKASSDQADTIFVTAEDTIANIDASLDLGALIGGQVRNWGVGARAQVELYMQGNENPVNSTDTEFDGTYAFTVPPGTYYVRFELDGQDMYYDNSPGGPGTPINISGTEEVLDVDADFEVGPPPPPPAPKIVSVKDVPNDQGKKVLVTWVGNEPPLIGGEGIILGVERFSVWFRWDGVWTFVAEVPAKRDSLYSVIAPTFVDSTITGGIHWSKYQVTSHYTFNFHVVNSMVDSGYSLDNLVPGVPGAVGGSVNGSDFVLHWTRVPDEDVQYYAVYRSTVPDFDVTSMSPHSTTADTTFTDAGAVGGPTYYYRVTAIDYSGNQSASSDPIGTSVTGVEATEALPTTYALFQNFPNPFNPTTQIAYDVPQESFVTLKVYNTLGQEIAVLVEARQLPGRHTVSFNGSGLASGLYFYKLTAGEHVSIRKMNLLK